MSIMHPPRSLKAAAGPLLAVFLALVGCAAVPYQEMSDARQAIESAEPVVADVPGAREQVSEARALLDAAEAHLRAGEYAQARRTAEQAKAMAIDARERAESTGE